MQHNSEMELRPEVLAIAQEMERRLRRHDARRGDTWKTAPLAYLHMRLLEHRVELYDLVVRLSDVKRGPDPQYVFREAADLCNYTWMLVLRYKMLWDDANKPKPPPT
jgi:hypothetical protein